MKKHAKGKRFVLDQGASAVASLASLLEEDNGCYFMKKEKVFVIDLDENEKCKNE